MQQPLTILIVDDDPEIRSYISRTLGMLCPSVGPIREAESGARALDIIREGNVDVLVTDVQLPGLDGISLCRALDAEGTGLIPVLLVSGESSRAGDAREFAAAGAPRRAFLPKPFNASQLFAAFTNLLDSSGTPHD